MIRRSEADHLEMMRHPDRWPHLVLPLQHRDRMEPDGRMRLLGFMLEGEGDEAAPKVYVGSIYFNITGQKLEDLPVEIYPTLEAAVAAGWEVN